jgi:hypothetical protein
MRSFLTQMLLTYFLLLSIIQAMDNNTNRLIQTDDIMLKLIAGDNQEFVITKKIGIQAETIKPLADNL